jgi:hypothetical protein
MFLKTVGRINMAKSPESIAGIVKHEAKILAYMTALDHSITQSARDFHRDNSGVIVPTSVIRWAERTRRDIPNAVQVEAKRFFDKDSEWAKLVLKKEGESKVKKLIVNEWQELIESDKEK